MRPQRLGAVLSLSVDLEGPSSASAPERDATPATVERLVGLIEDTGLVATWATADPIGSPLIRLVREAGTHHEAALLAERSVAGFVRRLAQARAAGIPVATLAVGDEALLPAGELLVKHGISAVRAAGASGLRAALDPSAGPAMIRYGLWQLQPALRLGSSNTLAHWMQALQLRRAIERCIARSSILHLTIDAAALSPEPRSRGWRTVQNVLLHAQRRQNAGTLQVLTIQDIVAQLSAVKSARSAQSILRAA